MSTPALAAQETISNLRDLQAHSDWVGEANFLEGARIDHPTHGWAAGFDPLNQDHLHAQSVLVKAMSSEEEYRSRLALEVADRSYYGLDIIGKLSVLHALDRYVQVPTRAERIVSEGSDTPLGQGRAISALAVTKIIRGVDSTLREVDSVLRVVSVEERHRWVDDMWLDDEVVDDQEAPAEEVPVVFDSQYHIRGIVDKRQRSFPLWHPVALDSGAVVYEIPHDLTGVKVMAYGGRTANGNPPHVGKTIFRQYKDREHALVVDIPLVAVMSAQGMNTDNLESTFSDEHGNSTLVRIDRATLSNEAQSM